MSMKRAWASFASALLLISPLLGLSACSSGNENAAEDLGLVSTASYNGVSFAIDPTWETSYGDDRGLVTPSDTSSIVIHTYTDGETSSWSTLQSLESPVLEDENSYTTDDTWELDDVSVSAYTSQDDSSCTSVVIGDNQETGNGFTIFFDRGNADDMGTLDDETYEAILESIEFDESQAQPFSDSKSSEADADSDETTPVESTTDDSTDDASETSVETSTSTVSQQNALRSAESYLRFTHFSYSGLIGQLEYEGYSTEDATWAADNCGADWNEQALGSALDYLDYTAFSYSGLIDQLEYEGFTTEQATYAVDNCDADWNEQAALSAQSYLDFMAFSRDGLIEQLEYEGFTYEQAVYGVNAVGL